MLGKLKVKYSCLTTLSDDHADIFIASVLISLSLILPSTIMTVFYILSKRFCLKCKGFSDARVVSLTKEEYDFAQSFKSNIIIR